MLENKALIFSSVPDTFPVPGKDLTVRTTTVDPDGSPPENGITTKNHYASLDPYMRGRLRSPEIRSYAPAFTLGRPLDARTIATVLKSDHPGYKPGDLIHGMIPMEMYSSLTPEQLSNYNFRVIDNPYRLDPRLFIGALGWVGLTAYSSLYDIGAPKRGETIFVSAASGAVGQIVGQLCKREGLTVLGSVGSDEKLEFILKTLEFDGGFNYKKEKPAGALERLLGGKGIDLYYDNVGGEQLEAALNLMNDFGRIVACGMISQYNKRPEELYGVKNLMNVVSKRLKMQGFIVGDPNMGPKYFDDFQRNVQRWIHEGSFLGYWSETDGVDKAADGFVGMLKGENFGKAILKYAELG